MSDLELSARIANDTFTALHALSDHAVHDLRRDVPDCGAPSVQGDVEAWCDWLSVTTGAAAGGLRVSAEEIARAANLLDAADGRLAHGMAVTGVQVAR